MAFSLAENKTICEHFSLVGKKSECTTKMSLFCLLNYNVHLWMSVTMCKEPLGWTNSNPHWLLLLMSVWNSFWLVTESDSFCYWTLLQDWWNRENKQSHFHFYKLITSSFEICFALCKIFFKSMQWMLSLAGILSNKWDGVFNVRHCWLHLETL